jgi:hypothetical protein
MSFPSKLEYLSNPSFGLSDGSRKKVSRVFVITPFSNNVSPSSEGWQTGSSTKKNVAVLSEIDGLVAGFDCAGGWFTTSVYTATDDKITTFTPPEDPPYMRARHTRDETFTTIITPVFVGNLASNAVSSTSLTNGSGFTFTERFNSSGTLTSSDRVDTTVVDNIRTIVYTDFVLGDTPDTVVTTVVDTGGIYLSGGDAVSNTVKQLTFTGGGQNLVRTQTLSNEFDIDSLKALMSPVDLSIGNGDYSLPNFGSNMIEEKRKGLADYNISSGVVRFRALTDTNYQTVSEFYEAGTPDNSERHADIEAFKDLTEWNGGLDVDYTTTKISLSPAVGSMTDGTRTTTLSTPIPAEKTFRDDLGVWHPDHIDIDDIPAKVQSLFSAGYNERTLEGLGYAKIFDWGYPDSSLAELGRERLVCLDGIERRIEFVLSGMEGNSHYNYFYHSGYENGISESFTLETTDFVSPWLNSRSSTNEYNPYTTYLTAKVFVKDSEGEWVEELWQKEIHTLVEGEYVDVPTPVSEMQTWDNLCDAKYYVESKKRVGNKWGFAPLDSSDGSYYTVMNIVDSGSISGSPDPDGCKDTATATHSYSATATYDEESGWISSVVNSGGTIIGGITCPVLNIDSVVEGSHPSNTIQLAGESYGSVVTTPTSSVQTYNGSDDDPTYYYASQTNRATVLSTTDGSTTIERPNDWAGSPFYDDDMLNNSPIPLPVDKGQGHNLTRARLVGRV